MTPRPVVCGRTLGDARRYARAMLGLTDVVAVSRPEHLRGLHVGDVYETPVFGDNPHADEIRKSVRLRQATAPKEFPVTAPTQQPSVGRVVHYQSYGTPGGEYLPEPRAAIITEVKLVGDTKAIIANGWGLSGYHADGVDIAIIRDGQTVPREDTPTTYRVGLCVLNPTGQFFNQDVPFAEVPTPGHWNWPPRA